MIPVFFIFIFLRRCKRMLIERRATGPFPPPGDCTLRYSTEMIGRLKLECILILFSHNHNYYSQYYSGKRLFWKHFVLTHQGKKTFKFKLFFFLFCGFRKSFFQLFIWHFLYFSTLPSKCQPFLQFLFLFITIIPYIVFNIWPKKMTCILFFILMWLRFKNINIRKKIWIIQRHSLV